MTNNNPLPATCIAPTDNYENLPPHVRDEAGLCIYCRDEMTWATYEAYTEHFYTFEYEGEPGHHPQEREEFEYFRDSCLGY